MKEPKSNQTLAAGAHLAALRWVVLIALLVIALGAGMTLATGWPASTGWQIGASSALGAAASCFVAMLLWRFAAAADRTRHRSLAIQFNILGILALIVGLVTTGVITLLAHVVAPAGIAYAQPRALFVVLSVLIVLVYPGLAVWTFVVLVLFRRTYAAPP